MSFLRRIELTVRPAIFPHVCLQSIDSDWDVLLSASNVMMLIRSRIHRRVVSGISFAAVCATAGVLPASAEFRTWTDLKGRKIEAELIEVDFDKGVHVRMENGKQVWLPMEKLGARDRMFARKEFARMHQEAAAAKSDPPSPTGKEAEPVEKPTVQPNFSSPWPAVVSGPTSPVMATSEIGDVTKAYVCESRHYRMVSSARLSKSVRRKLMTLFEATHLYCAQVPLNFIAPRVKNAPKIPIMLFENESDYVKAGGVRGMDVSLQRASGALLATFNSLGLKKVGQGYSSNSSGRELELIGKLVEQLAPDQWRKVPWLTHGLGAYMRVTPYRSGKYVTSNMKRSVFEFVVHPIREVDDQEYLIDSNHQESELERLMDDAGIDDKMNKEPLDPGFGLGTEFRSPSLVRLMGYDAMRFDADLLGDKQRSTVNYGVATLLVHYLIHVDGNGDAKQMKKYLFALQNESPHTEAVNELYNGRTPEKFQESFQNYWRRAGITITFLK